MKKTVLLALTMLLIVSKDVTAQNHLIRITNTQIIAPDTIVIDTLNQGEQTYIKIIIKNDRPNSVEIKNIKTPPGTGASIETTLIKPKTQTELFVGFDTNWMNVNGNFVAKIILETNLIKDIVINVKGFVNQSND